MVLPIAASSQSMAILLSRVVTRAHQGSCRGKSTKISSIVEVQCQACPQSAPWVRTGVARCQTRPHSASQVHLVPGIVAQ
jgi:hypothetical protein